MKLFFGYVCLILIKQNLAQIFRKLEIVSIHLCSYILVFLSVLKYTFIAGLLQAFVKASILGLWRIPVIDHKGSFRFSSFRKKIFSKRYSSSVEPFTTCLFSCFNCIL